MKKQTVDAHDAINAFTIGRLAPFDDGPATQHGPDARVAIGGQVGDHSPDFGEQLVFRQRRAASAPGGAPGRPRRDIGAGDADRLADGLHCEPSLGSDSDRNIAFFELVATSRASFRISASSVFLPRSRCNSRICSCWAWKAEAGSRNHLFLRLRRARLAQPADAK